MSFIKKFISKTLLIGFLGLLWSPSLFANGLSNNGFVLTVEQGFGSCINANYHCEKIDETTYSCEKNSEISANQSTSFRELTNGNHQITERIGGFFHQNEKIIIPEKLGEKYKNPDPFRYPFVSIIKIQV